MPPGADQVVNGAWSKCTDTDPNGTGLPYSTNCTAEVDRLRCDDFKCYWEDVSGMTPTTFTCKRTINRADVSITAQR